MQIVFYAAELLGRSECHDPNTQAYKDDYAVLRFITPIAKAYVCKIGVQACSEAMESLGGQGYMEETGMGRCVRDAQVNTIWEGTTNVLAMDVLRVINETKGQAMLHLQKVIKKQACFLFIYTPFLRFVWKR
jgi:alkylation response protein AidB-like acyl-CoA dehydrogenase